MYAHVYGFKTDLSLILWTEFLFFSLQFYVQAVFILSYVNRCSFLSYHRDTKYETHTKYFDEISSTISRENW